MTTETKQSSGDKEKAQLKNKFVRMFRDALKTCPGATWTVEHWGGIRGSHPEWTHRFSPVGFVVWAETGLQPSLRCECESIDAKLSLDIVSYEIGEACENFDDAESGKGSLRSKIISSLP